MLLIYRPSLKSLFMKNRLCKDIDEGRDENPVDYTLCQNTFKELHCRWLTVNPPSTQILCLGEIMTRATLC